MRSDVVTTPDRRLFGSKNTVGGWLITLALVYLGVESAVRQYVGAYYGPFSVSLMLGIALATLGWRSAAQSPALGTYMRVAGPFAAWVLISSVAAWSPLAARGSVAFVLWLAFVIPGLAMLIADDDRRKALQFGLVGGASVYAVTAGYRLASGGSVVDAVVAGKPGNVGLILGVNRNIVSMILLVAGAVLLGGFGPRLLRAVRWPLVVLGFLCIADSGGRSGIIGLAVLAIVLGVYQPGVSRRIRRLLVALLAGVTFVVVTQAIGGQAATSSDRLVNLFSDERTVTDDARALDSRRAWNLGLDYPWFGIGSDAYQGSYHPVLEESNDRDVRRLLDTLTAHNTYGLVLAENGFPAAILFIAVIATLVFGGIRRGRDREVRFMASGASTVFVMIAFDGLLGTVLYLPMALTLGTMIAFDRRTSDHLGIEAPSGS